MMKGILTNKHVVITGASSGIGAQLAIKVAKHGGRPILLARSKEKLANLCNTIKAQTGIDCHYYQLDVSDFTQVKIVMETVVQEFGHIDILVNNAGFGVFETFSDADFTEITEMFAVNVLGLMACTKAVLPHMIERGSGHIINVASQAGKIATPKSSVYSATKHAVLGFTNSLRMELADQNIYVSAVNPGPIATNFFDRADKSRNYVKNVQKYMLESEVVADKMIELMMRPKRELNLPFWMNAGSIIYQLFPNLFEKVSKKFFHLK